MWVLWCNCCLWVWLWPLGDLLPYISHLYLGQSGMTPSKYFQWSRLFSSFFKIYLQKSADRADQKELIFGASANFRRFYTHFGHLTLLPGLFNTLIWDIVTRFLLFFLSHKSAIVNIFTLFACLASASKAEIFFKKWLGFTRWKLLASSLNDRVKITLKCRDLWKGFSIKYKQPRETNWLI